MAYRSCWARGLLLLAVACGASDEREMPSGNGSTSQDTAPLVELFSWWTAPGEADALQALVDTHKLAQPNARIFNAAAASGTQARQALTERLARNEPPDLFQQNAHDMRTFVALHPDRLVALDGLFEELGLSAQVYPELLENVSVAGQVFAMPVNIHRENTLFYNAAIFAAHGLTPPTTFEEFSTVCRVLREKGVDPLATSHQGWILRIMFNSIAMGRLGSASYQRYFSGAAALDEPAMRGVIDTFAEVLADYTNADAGEEGFGWTSAAQAVYNGDAAMFLHGDWAKGYFVQLGWVPGEDFGAVGAPGASDLFLYGIDTFSLPKGAPNEQGARNFLATIASRAGQLAFNRLKGSSSILVSLPKEGLDEVARAAAYDLERARMRMPLRARPEWDDAFSAFAKTRDREALLRVYLAYPPLR